MRFFFKKKQQPKTCVLRACCITHPLAQLILSSVETKMKCLYGPTRTRGAFRANQMCLKYRVHASDAFPAIELVNGIPWHRIHQNRRSGQDIHLCQFSDYLLSYIACWYMLQTRMYNSEQTFSEIANESCLQGWQRKWRKGFGLGNSSP